jgi:hypothetical protein
LGFDKIACGLLDIDVPRFKVRRRRVPSSFNQCVCCFPDIIYDDVYVEDCRRYFIICQSICGPEIAWYAAFLEQAAR